MSWYEIFVIAVVVISAIGGPAVVELLHHYK